MADVKRAFASDVAVVVTLASLAGAAARASDVIDNSSNEYLDALLAIQLKSGASGNSASTYVNIWLYGTVDGGTTYTEGATGSDAAITLTNPPNAIFLASMNVVANATTYKGGPWSVARAFGGILPAKWGVIIDNKAGALDSTEGNHLKKYQGIYTTVG